MNRPATSRRARPVLRGPEYTSPHYHSRVWGPLIFLGLILLLILVGGVGGGLYWATHRSESSSTSQLQFRVGTGDTVTTIADRLQSDGLISNTLLFRLDARLHGLAGKLKVGVYTLRRNMSIDDLVSALSVYRSVNIAITIPEGQRHEQIADALSAHGIDAASFDQEVLHPGPQVLRLSILADKPPGANLEGYLFPETYEVPPHYSGKLFALGMVRLLDREFTPKMRADARAEGLSVYRVLTLASIVEREARVASERPLIASVYLNRLHGGWFFGADPTVQYIIGHPGDWWPQLHQLARTIHPESPYNSYTHQGLPPGPIANPGLASIRAVIYPAHTQYFYFVAKGNTGYHAFARTQEEQDANIAKYQP